MPAGTSDGAGKTCRIIGVDARLPLGEVAPPARYISAVNANEPPITPALVAEHGLKPEEYQRILDLIGREPSFTELGIFSAMWNEHCSYKSSRIHLRGLPTKAPWVIQGPGENAGVIDIGDGQAVVFKRSEERRVGKECA